MSHQSDLTRAIETALKLSQRADLGELPRPAQAEASEGARPVDGMTAKNWELAYDKACRERDEVKAERDSLAEQYRQACIDSDKWEKEARRQPAQGGLPGVDKRRLGHTASVFCDFYKHDRRVPDEADVIDLVEHTVAGEILERTDGKFVWRRVPQPQTAVVSTPLVRSAAVVGEDARDIEVEACVPGIISTIYCRDEAQADAIAKLLTEATLPAVATKEGP